MKKRNLLILILTMLIIFLTMGVMRESQAATTCTNCKKGSHSSCTKSVYTNKGSSGHTQKCCCSVGFSIASAGHTATTYVNTASTCYRCVCGYTEGHNTSGGYCPNAHCEYNSKPRCSRGCSHAKWTSCRGHSYSSTWSTDASNHWKVCTVVSSCSSVSSKAAHADTNNDGSCDTCGYAMVVATKVSKPTAPSRNFTYTGSAQSIGLSGYDSSIMSLSGGTATNAGNYIATISLRDATSYQWSDGTTSSVSFSWSISRASISVPTASNYIYDGSQKTGVSSGTGYTISGTNTATNVALYTVTVTPDSNHQWSDGTTSAKNLEWAIMARTISIPTGRTYTYDGTTKTGVSSGTGYTLSGTTTASAVGTYIVYASLLSNYAWSDGSMEDKTIYWYIENATVTDYSPTVTLSTTNGTSATITATLRDSEGLAGYAFTYSSSTPSSWTSISGTYRTVSRSYEETGYIYVWVKDTAGQTSYDRVYIEKVTYDANGGSGAPSTEYKVDGTSISISTTKPTKSGYTFKEWNTKSDGTGTFYAPGATYSTNTSLSLYAIYEQDTPVDSLPTITYSTTNGIAVYFTATLADVEGLAGYAWTTTSAAPTTWTSISGTSQLITKTFQTTGAQYIWVKDTAGQATNKQIWIESLTYDANGGTGAPSPEYKVDGTSIQISNTTPTKEGYLFKEWNTISAGTGTSYLPGATYSNDNSLTLYAIYRSEDEIDGPNDATVYEGQTAKFTVTGAKAGSKYKWYQVRNSVTTEVSQMYKSNIEGKANTTASATITLNTTVSGKISFDYKVSSETNYDKFTVKVNSTTVASAISGAGDWISYGPTTYTPTSGKITITLTYTKDGSQDKNDDCGYIRNIKFVTDANPDGDVDGIITYTSSTFGFTGLDGSKATLKIPNTTTSMSGNQYYCVVTDTNGEVQTSRSGTLTVNEDTRPTLMTRDHKFLTASGLETDSYVNAATRIWYAIGARRAGKEQYTSEKIRTIQILDTNVSQAPTSYVATWDASANQNGTINVYLKTSTEDSTLYDMYICAAGGIKATDATWLFGAYENCISINGMELVDIGSATIANALFMNNKKMTYVNVSDLDTSNLKDMTHMFRTCESLEYVDVSNFDTSNATDTSWMFAEARKLKNVNVSNFDTSNVTNMEAMFYECKELEKLDVSSFDTSKVTNMYSMFCLCEKIKEIKISSLFNTQNVTTMDSMFRQCYQLETVDVSGFNTSKVTNMGVMFYLCHSLKTIDVSGFDTTNVTNMRGMFTECWEVETLDVSNFNTSKVTDMAAMFHTCRKVSVIDVSGFDTSKVTDMDWMFSGCSGITELDVSGFNTANVTRFEFAFNGLHNVEVLDVSKFNTAKAVTMASMFMGANKLKELNVTSFSTASVENMNSMFEGCTLIKSLNLSNFNTSKVTSMDRMFTDSVNLESILLGSSFNKLNGENMFNGCTALKAIISERQTSSSIAAPTLTTNIGINGEAIFYVPNTTALTYTKSATNYSTVFGTDRIHRILELIGTSPMTSPLGVIFNDPGVTVAGMEKTVIGTSTTYTPYNYTVTISGLTTAPTTTGNQYRTYTLKKGTTTIVSISRTVNVVSMGKLMTRESGINGTENYAIGAKRAGKTQYTGDKIKTITLQASLTAPTGYVDTWDVSYSQDGTVKAWVVKSAEDSTMYDLYIGANNGIIAPSDGYMLFAFYTKCTKINNLNLLNTSATTSMRGFFYRLYVLESLDLSNFSMSSCTNAWDMFSDCQALTTLDLSNFDTSKLIYATYMFYGCKNVTNINLENFNTSNVTDASGMFYNCQKLASLDVSDFDTKNVINMYCMFNGCSSLTSLDLSNFDTSKATNMGWMFGTCGSLTNINLSSFDTSKVTDMSDMFYYCSNLTSLDVNNFDTSKVTNMKSMFRSCRSLTSLDASSFDTSKVTNMDDMFYFCDSLTSLNLGQNFDKLTGNDMFKVCSNLKAIITPRTTIMTLNDNTTTDTGLSTLTNAVLYVPTILAETTFEADTNYANIFGADRIKLILELVGNNPKNAYLNVPYKDEGVTVAGMTKNADGTTYTPYGYTVSGPVIKKDGTIVSSVDTSILATYTLTYTIVDPSGVSGMSITRTVNVSDKPMLMERDRDYEGNCYSIGAARAAEKLSDDTYLNYGTGNIKTITLVDLRTTPAPTDYLATWDAGYEYGSNSVVAYIKTNEEYDSMQDLYLCAYGKIYAPENSSSLFAYYNNCEEINGLENLNTSMATNFSSMFESCSIVTNLNLSNFDTSNALTMNQMFMMCESLESLDLSNFDTNNVIDMGFMISYCPNLKTLNISNFNTPNLLYSFGMFDYDNGLESLDLSNFDTTQMEDMSGMFTSCENLKSIKLGQNFDKMTGEGMFDECTGLRAIITPRTTIMELNDNTTTETRLKPLTDAVVYVPTAAAETTFEADANYADILGADRIRPILELSGDNPAKVSKGATYEDAGVTVAGMTKNADGTTYTPYGYTVSGPVIKKDGTVVSSIDTSTKGTYTYTYTIKDSSNTEGMSVTRDVIVKDNPTLMQRDFKAGNSYTFYAIGAYRADNSTTYTADKIKKITLIDLSKESAPTNYLATWDASYINGDRDVMAWIVTNAEDSTMYDLYLGAEGKIYAPENSHELFSNYNKCTAINGLKNLDTRKVATMAGMFSLCGIITELDVSNFDTSNVNNMGWMFYNCSNLKQLDVSHFDTSNVVTDMNRMFYNCSSLEQIDVSNFNTGKVTAMSGMFYNCNRLTQLDVENFNTNKVENMSSMFYGCSNIRNLNVSSFNTSNVTNMYCMFYECSSLATLDVSNFDTSKVTDMSNMFSSSTNLKTIYASDKFVTTKVTSSTNIFTGCTNLVGGAGTKYNKSYLDKTYARIDGGTSNPGYFTNIADKPSEPNSFATDSWKTIINAVKNNNIGKYNVGDTKTVSFTWEYIDFAKELGKAIFTKATSFEIIDEIFKEGSETISVYSDNSANDSKSSTSEVTSDSEDWDKALDEYEKYIDSYIKILKKVKANDMSAISEYPTYVEKAESFSKKFDNAKGTMSAKQIKRYTELTMKITTAAME